MTAPATTLQQFQDDMATRQQEWADAINHATVTPDVWDHLCWMATMLSRRLDQGRAMPSDHAMLDYIDIYFEGKR